MLKIVQSSTTFFYLSLNLSCATVGGLEGNNVFTGDNETFVWLQSVLPSFLLSLTGHCYKCVFHQTKRKKYNIMSRSVTSIASITFEHKNVQSQNWIIKSFFSSTRKFLGKYLTSLSLNHKDFLHFSFRCHFRGGLQELPHFSLKFENVHFSLFIHPATL